MNKREEQMTDVERCPLCQKAVQPDICSVLSHSGPTGEPLACGYPPDHDGVHSWATLPTWARA